MPEDLSIERVGESTFDSPLDSAVFIHDGEGVLIDATLSGYQKGDAHHPSLKRLVPERRFFSIQKQAGLG